MASLRARLAQLEFEQKRANEARRDSLSCELCMEMFDRPPGRRVPKALSCQHSFCALLGSEPMAPQSIEAAVASPLPAASYACSWR